jgi:hypothetical protein
MNITLERYQGKGFMLISDFEKQKEYTRNAEELLEKIHKLHAEVKLDFIMNSGARLVDHNTKVGGAAKSLHLTHQAIDLSDKEGLIDLFAHENPSFLQEIGLWHEHGMYTKNWAHFQSVPPKSGKTTFIPYSYPPKAIHFDKIFFLSDDEISADFIDKDIKDDFITKEELQKKICRIQSNRLKLPNKKLFYI